MNATNATDARRALMAPRDRAAAVRRRVAFDGPARFSPLPYVSARDPHRRRESLHWPLPFFAAEASFFRAGEPGYGTSKKNATWLWGDSSPSTQSPKRW